MTNPPDTSVTERVARAILISIKGGQSDRLSPERIAEDAAVHAIAAISSMPSLEEENAVERVAISSMPSLEEENARLREALRDCANIMRDYRQVWANPAPYDTAMNEAAALTSTREGLSTEQGDK